jgi:gas vesicle protein
MKKNTSGILAFLFGGMVGAIVALMYAPQSREETRQDLIEGGQKIKKETLESIQEAKNVALTKLNEIQARIDTTNDEVKERLSRLKEVGKNTVAEQKGTLEKGYKKAKDVLVT